jgi:hypothetical protein
VLGRQGNLHIAVIRIRSCVILYLSTVPHEFVTRPLGHKTTSPPLGEAAIVSFLPRRLAV